MAASSKFDFSSSSPDGPTHLNGHRGAHAMASLDRSGSFRDGTENRIASSLSSIPRTGSVSSQGDITNLFQSLISDLKAVVTDQKFSRHGEIKRSISSIFGVSLEDTLPATFSLRPLSVSSLEEIRRTRSHLQECVAKASDRSKLFGEAVSKLDKYHHNLPRKRYRADNSPSERSNAVLLAATIPKNGSQSHFNATGLEIGLQRSDERAKSAVPNRRIRTSMAEVRMDVRGNGVARPSGPMDKDRDVFKLVNSGTAHVVEKGRALATGTDGWEKSKMKKKRSVIKSDVSTSTVPVRLPDGDRESKRGMQQKLITDARPRLNNTHGFRSGPVPGAVGVGKLDSASQPSGLGTRLFTRNDQENGSFPNERRDRIVGLDKEGVTLKTANRTSSRDDNCAGSPTTVVKVNASARGPRSNSGSMSKGPPNINRALATDDWEHPQCVNKMNSAGAISRKRSTSACTTSPPVTTQWVGQRPQKISRVARRSNLPPVVSNHDEYPMSEVVDNTAVNDDVLEFPRRSSSNVSQQSKAKGEHGLFAGLSESEESGVVDNKSKNKSKKCSETEEKTGASAQRVTPLVPPSRKNKVASEEDLGDGVRRHGKIGRGFAPGRSMLPASVEKRDSAATVKQMRSARVGYEKIESRVGRPPTKKWSERKGHTRPRHSLNSEPLEIAGESDDHEELLAAANAAMNTSQACPSLLLKQTEQFLRFLSAKDKEFLDHQIRLADEFVANVCVTGDDNSLKGDPEYVSLSSAPALSRRDASCGRPDEIFRSNECDRDIGLACQSKHIEPFLEQLVRGNGAQNGVSICQALLSAIIEEDEIEKFDYKGSEDCLYGNAHRIYFEVDGELKLKGVERAAPNACKANSGWRYHEELARNELGSNGSLDELLHSLSRTSSTVCTELEYTQMCIDDRILLELSEIGLHPEPVPYLAQSEDEDIGEGITRLEEMLHEQVLRKKNMLLELQKAVNEVRESQQRELEHIALDRLVGIAYERYMQAFGPNASGKNTSRSNKQATLAFVGRTLLRRKKFEETGTSCFSELPFRDMFRSVPSHNNDAECVGIAADVEAPYQIARAQHSEISLTDQNLSLASESIQRVDTCDKYSDAFPSVNCLSEQVCSKEGQWSSRLKKRELLLDDVVSSAAGSLRTPPGIGSSLVSGTKGKRSEREREGKGQNRDSLSRNGTAKTGQSALSNIKGERKNKSKPKQKTAQLSASVNGLLGKATDIPTSGLKSHEMVAGRSTKKEELSLVSSYASGVQDMSSNAEAIDLCNLQLPEIDVGDFGGQGQDIGSWLNIEDDGMQDHDFMGLEIPMDDLSEVNMMI